MVKKFTLGMIRWEITETAPGLYQVCIHREPGEINKKKQVINWVQLTNATLEKAEEYIANSTRKRIDQVQNHTRGEDGTPHR